MPNWHFGMLVDGTSLLDLIVPDCQAARTDLKCGRIVDLLQGRLGQLFQLFVAAIFLRFQLNQDARKALLRGLQLNVIAPVARFPVGGHESAAQQGAQSQHKAVVEVLPGGIEGADRLGQQRLNLRFQPCVIAGEDGLLNGDRRGRRDQIL